MPFQEFTIVSSRESFVREARQADANLRALCRAYGISPTTGYRWLNRYRADGDAGLRDHSRRPHTSPARTADEVAAGVLALRREHPAWGGRKLHHRLRALGQPAPAASTCTEILRREGVLDPERVAKPRALQRFTADGPNALWQMDFKGGITLQTRSVSPLLVIDDASRSLLAAHVCLSQSFVVVHGVLQSLFRLVGLPERILCDNGNPWASPPTPGSLTRLGAWWIRLGIRISHGRPFHPQTQGKVERAMRISEDELFRWSEFGDGASLQAGLDQWRQCYNTERPHESLDFATPASRYQPSPRVFPELLPPIVYRADDIVRKVSAPGVVSLHNQRIRISHALIGEPVAFRPTATDGVYSVHYCDHYVREIDVRTTLRSR